MQNDVEPIIATVAPLVPTTTCGWPDRDVSVDFNNPDVIYADQVIRPMWMFLCTTGNILNVVLLHRILTYQKVFLVGMAWFDLTCMWAWFGLYIGGFVWKGHAMPPLIRIITAVGNTLAQCSDWTLLAFSITRVLCTIFPLKARALFTVFRARVVLVVILVPATATFLYDFVSVSFPANATDQWQTEWTTVHIKGTAFAELITFFAIFASNIFVIGFIKIQHIQQQLDRSTPESPSDSRPLHPGVENGHQANGFQRSRFIRVIRHVKRSQTTATLRMLTASTCLYILTRSPVVIYQIMEKMCVARMTDHQYSIFVGVHNQFLFASYSLQFVLYCAVNPPYLKRALHVLRYCKIPPPVNSPAGSRIQSTSSARSLRRETSAPRSPEPVEV
ncbi:uncharacterized protein LOC129583086 [Paramacrobiotus metropolitanus]|uniref:uncharacterized protein LOC129583086 n=1 Tax=Paramacrobiotus metropolitanus TaxID=2943436 RepID=UPI0024460EE5|nr:uncharacterized protein LOC129583086 [Paramacrobiotus metropolitanus]XP_055330770.1 uncharacterized protein LOC129583086 [Paramacrobiotus metropolitanus]